MHRCAYAICSPTTNTFCTLPGASEKYVLFGVLLWLWSKKHIRLDARGAKNGCEYFLFVPDWPVSACHGENKPGVQELKCLLYERVLIFNLALCSTGGRDSSVGIATRYGLDGLEFESRSGRDLPQQSRPNRRPTQSGLCLGQSGRGVELTTYPQSSAKFNPLNAELNPIRHLLALLGAHHILYVGRIRFKSHLASAGIVRSSPYSPRWQSKG